MALASRKDEAEARAAIAQLASSSYDLVINGYEMGSGSIRIHQTDVQNAIFTLLGMDAAEIDRRFGWFVDCLKHGTPPHGGIALGLERLVMVLLGTTSIQDVVAFPKTMSASDLLSGAPATVETQQWTDLGLKVSPLDPSA